MKRKRMLAVLMAVTMTATLTMGMPMTGYAMDQGTETVASEPEAGISSDTTVTNPEQDTESVMASTAEETDAVSESQGKDPDVASVAESKEAKSGAMAAPDTQSNSSGHAEQHSRRGRREWGGFSRNGWGSGTKNFWKLRVLGER